MAACPVDYELASQPEATLTAIAAHGLILYPERPRPSFADQVLGIFDTAGVSVRIQAEVKDLQTALGLTASGMGVAIVPNSIGQTARRDVVFLPIHDGHAISPIIATYREQGLSDAARTLLDKLANISRCVLDGGTSS